MILATQITDLKEAKIAKALFKQELKRLMDEKKILLDRYNKKYTGWRN